MRFVRYSLVQSDDGTASLFQTGRPRPAVSHRRSFVICLPGDDEGAWSIARAIALNTKIKTAKISSGVETGFSRKFGPAKISCYTVAHATAMIGGYAFEKGGWTNFEGGP